MTRLLLSPRLAETAIVFVACAIAVFLSHDMEYLLNWPLWGDEAWVVISRNFPLSDLPSLISSTPIGWNLLVQVFSSFGDTCGRVLVQLFTVGAAVAAYGIGRALSSLRSALTTRAAGAIVAISVVSAPASLLRNDIKHYTADAFITLVIMLLVILVIQSRDPDRDHNRDRSALITLTVVSSLGLTLAFATLFASGAAFLALAVHSLLVNDRRQFRETVIAGVIAAVSLALWYSAFYIRGDIPSLREFWQPQYPQSLMDLPRFIGTRLLLVDDQTAFHSVFVILPLVIIGTLILWRHRLYAIALFGPLMLLLMTTLGLLERYPLLDGRTSHFFLIFTSVFTAVSIVLLLDTLYARALRGKRPAWVSRSWVPTVAIATLALIVIVAASPSWRAKSLPGYSVEAQIDYVLKHAGPSDLILFNNLASYQVGISWTRDEPSWCPNETAWTGFDICYPGVDDLRGFNTLNEAYELMDRHLEAAPGSAVWLIRSHVFVAYEQMEVDLPNRYEYQVIDLPIQPLGVVTGIERAEQSP
jgi:hypothetical protein